MIRKLTMFVATPGIALLALTLVLAGCATTGSLTPAQGLYGAETAYAASLELAVAYRRLPLCGTGPAICHDPAVVARLVAMSQAANTALQVAQNAVTANQANAGTLVLDALTLIQAYQAYAVSLNKD